MSLPSFSYYQENGRYEQALRLAKKTHADEATLHILENSVLNIGYSKLFFDEHDRPRASLIHLLQIVGMDNPEEIHQINAWAQKNLLRQGERWEEQTQRFEQLKPQIESFLRENDFFTDISAHFPTYEGAILHGATLIKTRVRLEHLIKQWQEGVRFSYVYFLTGARPLDPKEESKEAFLQQTGSLNIKKGWSPPSIFPKTEAEMMEFIWEQSDLPETMRAEVKVHCINAPMKQDPKTEKLLRPTTNDTIELWLKNNPPIGRYMVISMAPHIQRQDLVMRTIASKDFGFDTIGPALKEHESVAIFLDELARTIFQQKLLVEKKNSF